MEKQLFRLIVYATQPDEKSKQALLKALARDFSIWFGGDEKKRLGQVLTHSRNGKFEVTVMVPIRDRSESVVWEPGLDSLVKDDFVIERDPNLIPK